MPSSPRTAEHHLTLDFPFLVGPTWFRHSDEERALSVSELGFFFLQYQSSMSDRLETY